MKANAKQLARQAESNSAFEAMARAGYVASGIVHGLIGVIVLIIASGGRAEGDQAGALKAVAAAPVGFVVLWLLAIGLWALALWHAGEGLLAYDYSGDTKGAARKWSRRIAEWGQAVVFAGLGLIAAAVAMGARPNAEKAAEGASRGLLDIPGGSILLALIGVGIGIGGISFVVMGARRSFRKPIRIPDGKWGRALTILGIAGFIAKGIALIIVGVLLTISAIRREAKTAGGLDGAVDAMLNLPLGPALAWVVGVGFLAYAVFTIARAWFARM